MATIIIGGGIMGAAIAYYLSQSHSDPSLIHIIESSPKLFASASGYAGGFLAEDWFAPDVADLGSLSFDLHRQLSKRHDGDKEWGYAPSTALSLAIQDGRGIGKGQRGEDWLLSGTSRARVASQPDAQVLDSTGAPNWLTRQVGGSLDVIGGEDSCAQVDPKRLCEFLMKASREKGVQVHFPAHVVSIVKGLDGIIIAVKVQNDKTNDVEEIRCQSVALAAGAWTPSVFRSLFPHSSLKIPISGLAGYSVLVKSPRHTLADEKKHGRCHAVFAAPNPSYDWAPEIISRPGAEIWAGGLNSSTLPLPRLATETVIDARKMEELRKVTLRLMGKLRAAEGPGNGINEDDLQITREALCFRPVTSSGKPIIAKLADGRLGKDIRTAEDGGVFVASGHGPWGISLSLGTGKVVAEMMDGRRTSADIGRLGI